ncbi:hypothetical protein F2P81_001635 [Scophthalmus maximus]|uniref:Uncharacterized protein n=1 Tax=Scophthalmus maximus TaxID=52904 RepID=A0A6A4TBW9_SCOMX|nr:hypothetical protein F2P81_001635 [Scophthalmus maximus]
MTSAVYARYMAQMLLLLPLHNTSQVAENTLAYIYAERPSLSAALASVGRRCPGSPSSYFLLSDHSVDLCLCSSALSEQTGKHVTELDPCQSRIRRSLRQIPFSVQERHTVSLPRKFHCVNGTDFTVFKPVTPEGKIDAASSQTLHVEVTEYYFKKAPKSQRLAVKELRCQTDPYAFRAFSQTKVSRNAVECVVSVANLCARERGFTVIRSKRRAVTGDASSHASLVLVLQKSPTGDIRVRLLMMAYQYSVITANFSQRYDGRGEPSSTHTERYNAALCQLNLWVMSEIETGTNEVNMFCRVSCQELYDKPDTSRTCVGSWGWSCFCEQFRYGVLVRFMDANQRALAFEEDWTTSLFHSGRELWLSVLGSRCAMPLLGLMRDVVFDFVAARHCSPPSSNHKGGLCVLGGKHSAFTRCVYMFRFQDVRVRGSVSVAFAVRPLLLPVHPHHTEPARIKS